MNKIVLLLSCFLAFSDARPNIRGHPIASRNIFPRIVGGENAFPAEFPHIVSLQYNSQHLCGGTIIDTNTIVTAAHCIFDPINAYVVRAGIHNIVNPEDLTRQDRPISSVTVHPSYNPALFTNDIAVIKITEPFVFNSFVSAIDLPPTQNHEPTGNTVIVGWGALSDGGNTPQVLQKVTIPIVSDQVCRNSYEPTYPIADHMLCAGLSEGGKDSCTGDSGGPLMCSTGGSVHFCGIVSWAIGCAQPNFYGVNTQVSHFVDFINAARA